MTVPMQGIVRVGRRWAMMSMVACMAATPALANAPPPPAADPAVARSLQRLRDAGDTQFDFTPTPPPPEPPNAQPPQWLIDFFEWLGNGGRPLMDGLVYLLIGAALLFVLYLLVPAFRDWVDALLARWRKPKAASLDVADDGWQPDAHAARNLLAEADRLAAAGQFTEAVHLLLGRSLEELATRRPGLVKPALTARAIALLEDLPSAARRAFDGLARAVERGLWAQRPLAEGDWQQARADYADFALGSHWQGKSA